MMLGLPSWQLTAISPLKIDRLPPKGNESSEPTTIFQGRAVSFREGMGFSELDFEGWLHGGTQ